MASKKTTTPEIWAIIDGWTPVPENDLPDSTHDAIVMHTEYERNSRTYYRDIVIHFNRN